MTRTLRREAIKTIEDILIPALSDNPQTQEAIDYARELSAKCVDAMLEISGIARRFDLEQADIGWAVAGGKQVTDKQLAKQAEIADFEEMIEVQLNRFPLNWSGFKSTDQDRFRHHLKEAAEKGEFLVAYMDWWISNFIQKEQPPWTLGQIMIRWPQAFAVSTQPKHSEGRAVYGKYAEERNALGI